ncbi:hypothetical protein OG453_07485 [Streptomyces sp. NBC_01381]|uniref:hypothetical protein n=1 Tax=Streptomyces sp. NBC_01381 TaxID=2903845 RepID=UPI00224CE57A|nr:hypothetical protein [Streptomyces sp. NBC_01381]MCX4666511.1 hypothetical protein [Streptomyces sp. NBC_01381]
MRQLSLVVTCTDRKVDQPDPALSARNLPQGSVKQRSSNWQKRIQTATARGGSSLPSLAELYRGDHWTRSRRLVAAAASAGYKTQLWVASAGLGLQPVEPKTQTAPAYAATFSTRHADSVATSATENTQWWGHLQAGTGRSTLHELGQQGPVLMVLSEVYASAMEEELVTLGGLGGEALLIGGLREIPGVHRVRSDAGLSRALGGTLTSLNVRMAASWLEHSKDGMLTSPATQKAWSEWAAATTKPVKYNREPMSDEDVIVFIKRETAKLPGVSRTRLLRALRDDGKACEQSRFANLYKKTMGER